MDSTYIKHLCYGVASVTSLNINILDVLQKCYNRVTKQEKAMNIKDLTEEAGCVIKRKAACHGGEYCSPCPFCRGGEDRFLVWPNRPSKNGTYEGGRFSCRVCGKYGNAINFLVELRGISYKDACALLKIEPKLFKGTFIIRSLPSLQKVDDPPLLWQAKATKFVEWAHQQLLTNPNALALLHQRGLNLDSIIVFRLGFE